MQHQAMRWKGLMESRQSSQNISKQKPKRYTPARNQMSSQLNKKLKAVNSSKMNTSSDCQFPNKEQPSVDKSLIVKGVDTTEAKDLSPKRSGSDFNLSSKLKPMSQSSGPIQELASPTVLIKQMRQIGKKQTTMNHSKALFSLDQEHKYIHQQLFKIKSDYTKFKQVIMEQLVRYRKQIDSIVNKIMAQFQEVVQACSAVQHMPISIFDQPSTMRQSAKFTPFEQLELQSLNISIIKKQSSLGQSKAELKRLFGEQSHKIDKMLSNKTHQYFTERTKPYQPAKTERPQAFRPFNPISVTPKIPKQRSKKQFQKLFQAVNCLKKDFKDLNQMSVQGNKKEHNVHNNNHSNGSKDKAKR